MAETTIEWTDRVWNPVTGCTKVSPGCAHCYAEAMTKRFPAKFYPDGQFVPWTVKSQRESGTPAVMLHPERLEQPLNWKKPSRIFVNSMSDLFHEDVPFEFIKKVYIVMAQAYWHTFQILTKRPERRLEFFAWLNSEGQSGYLWNTWEGVSVENQRYAEERIPLLLQTPAAVRFLSVEPMLERVDLRKWLPDPSGPAYEDGVNSIDWTIVGAESGPKRRPFNEDWARDLRDQCVAAGVLFFYKQGSGPRPGMNRVLDGRTWGEMPEIHGGVKP